MQYHISSMPRPIAERHHGQHTLTIECVALDRGNARKPGALGSTSQKVSHCINDFLIIFTNRPLESGRNLSRDLPARGNSTSMSVSKALIGNIILIPQTRRHAHRRHDDVMSEPISTPHRKDVSSSPCGPEVQLRFLV
jgi:hypothetical protein